MYIANMASGCTPEEPSFVSLDDYDNTSFLLDEKNVLEEEITQLFPGAGIFVFKFFKKQNQSGSEYTQNMYRNTE